MQIKDGKNKEFGGGGIAFNQDGSERSLTQEEIMEELNAPDIEYEKDGSVILYYKISPSISHTNSTKIISAM